MEYEEPASPADAAIGEVIRRLDQLSEEIESEEHRSEIERATTALAKVPGGEVIDKYTTRDVGEAFVGGLLFSLPMLVEDGVFDIATWLTENTVAGFPLLLSLNAVLVVAVTAGLLYAVDFREIAVTRAYLGFVPRRLVGVVSVSFLAAALSMLLWGRLHVGDPDTVEALARISVVWAAASMGAVLADIAPGESKGDDIGDIVDVRGME